MKIIFVLATILALTCANASTPLTTTLRQAGTVIAKTRQVNMNNIPFRRGYSFDQCHNNDNCLGKRVCILADFSRPCDNDPTAPYNCFCFKLATQICLNCRQCHRFPQEVCVRIPGTKDATMSVRRVLPSRREFLKQLDVMLAAIFSTLLLLLAPRCRAVCVQALSRMDQRVHRICMMMMWLRLRHRRN